MFPPLVISQPLILSFHPTHVKLLRSLTVMPFHPTHVKLLHSLTVFSDKFQYSGHLLTKFSVHLIRGSSDGPAGPAMAGPLLVFRHF